MRLAANDENLSVSAHDDRLERARKLLRPAKKSTKRNTGPIMASAGLACAALLLASLMAGPPESHNNAPQVPAGGNVMPSGHAMRNAIPSTAAPHADFELSASAGGASGAAAETTPPVRDAILIGTEGEAH